MTDLWLPPEKSAGKPEPKRRCREEVFIRDIGDFGYCAVVSCNEPKEGDTPYWIDFEVYEIVGVEMHPVEGRLLFDCETPSGCSGTTHILDDADEFITGFIKWDGCSEWDLGNHHFCSVKQAASVGPLLRRLYEIAAQWMPSNDFDDELRDSA
jgi:hypothetical protein